MAQTMGQSPSTYLKEPYSRILIPNEDGIYSAEILEFPGCFAEGKDPSEAIRNLEASAEAWIEAALAQGQEIPEPEVNQGYGGKVALRLPRSVHRQAARLAEREDTSLNQFLVSAITARIGAEDLYTRLVERFEQHFARPTQNLYLWAAFTSTPPHPNLPGQGLEILETRQTTSQPWPLMLGNLIRREALANG